MIRSNMVEGLGRLRYACCRVRLTASQTIQDVLKSTRWTEDGTLWLPMLLVSFVHEYRALSKGDSALIRVASFLFSCLTLRKHPWCRSCSRNHLDLDPQPLDATVDKKMTKWAFFS
jgi:hypothetical protein